MTLNEKPHIFPAGRGVWYCGSTAYRYGMGDSPAHAYVAWKLKIRAVGVFYT